MQLQNSKSLLDYLTARIRDYFNYEDTLQSREVIVNYNKFMFGVRNKVDMTTFFFPNSNEWLQKNSNG